MSYGEFLATVRQRGEYQAEKAPQITEAVLGTLAQRLPPVSAEHLADQLPAPLDEIVSAAENTSGRYWGVEEFVRHVAERADEDEETAETDTRVVFSVLADQISGGEMNKVLSQLPTGYAELFGYSELT